MNQNIKNHEGIQVRMEHLINQAHERDWNIRSSEEHDRNLVVPVPSAKSGMEMSSPLLTVGSIPTIDRFSGISLLHELVI